MSDENPSSRTFGSDDGENGQGDNGIVALLHQFLGELTPTGDPEFDGPMLNARAAMKIATNAVFTGGLRESLIALLRSPYNIEPFIRDALADALERGASAETLEESGLHSWKLQLVGLGAGKGTQNNQGEQVRARRRWGNIGQFMQNEIASNGAKHGAREKAICAAIEKYNNISRQLAEKSLKYFQERQCWVENVNRILNTSFIDDIHRHTILESYHLEYDILHAHHKDAPAERLAEVEKFNSN